MLKVLGYTGKKFSEFINSVILFFQFLGELTDHILNNWQQVIWKHTIIANLRLGASILFPIMLISMLIGMGMAISIQLILAPYHLQQEAMVIAETSLLRDFAPFTIGFVLCVHCGLNLIDKDHPSLNKPPHIVLLETIVPLIVGLNFTAISLYTYVFASFLLSVFFISYYVVHTNIAEYLYRLSHIINSYELFNSLLKTLGYTTLASLITGYYYYGVAYKVISTRVAVSRVITRNLFWLVIVSVLLKLVMR